MWYSNCCSLEISKVPLLNSKSTTYRTLFCSTHNVMPPALLTAYYIAWINYIGLLRELFLYAEWRHEWAHSLMQHQNPLQATGQFWKADFCRETKGLWIERERVTVRCASGFLLTLHWKNTYCFVINTVQINNVVVIYVPNHFVDYLECFRTYL